MIDEFIQQLTLARTTRFKVDIIARSIVTFAGGTSIVSIGDGSSVKVEAVELPSLSISTTEFKYDQSPSILMPYQRTPQGQATLTLQLDEKHEFRKLMNTWMEKVIVVPTNFSSLYGYHKNYYNEFIGSVVISQLDMTNNPVATTTLLNAYPINIDSIRYDWGDFDQYVRLNVTFAYADMKSDF
jgi:hypothetical protein